MTLCHPSPYTDAMTTDEHQISESFAQRILEAAIAEERASELLGALIDGGSATVTNSGQLIILTQEQLFN